MSRVIEKAWVVLLHLTALWSLISLGFGALAVAQGHDKEWKYLGLHILVCIYLQRHTARSWIQVPAWLLGRHLRNQTANERESILGELGSDEDGEADAAGTSSAHVNGDLSTSLHKHQSTKHGDWSGVIGFFHPFW